jgi:hypothetical protein
MRIPEINIDNDMSHQTWEEEGEEEEVEEIAPKREAKKEPSYIEDF